MKVGNVNGFTINGDKSVLPGLFGLENAINGDDERNADMEPFVHDVCICGAGPGGLLLATQLANQGLSCAVVDPALDRPWPNNYGVWMDEAEHFGFDECCDVVWKEVGVIFDEKTDELVLNRPYGRVDRKKLKARLLQECCEATGEVAFGVAKAVDVQHFDDQPSQVTIKQCGDDAERVPAQKIHALLVVDATGFSRKFVKHDVEFNPGYQVTYGARFRVKDLGPYQRNRLVLMDYSEQHLHDDPELVKSNDRFPSFLYAMPLADDELFLEETILVSRPGGSSKNLEKRLYKRMESLGITAEAVLEDERAAIPMGGADPIMPQRTLGFGATASFVHPASGYMVARAMEMAPLVAQAVAPALKDVRQKLEKDGKQLEKQDFDNLAKVGWQAVWPVDERRQRAFMDFGFELLCLLRPQELRDFFTGFFRLPLAMWEHFLSWRLSGIGHVFMGLTVWATCIPRRFMPSMLIKSLPFIPKHLVQPFFTILTDSEGTDSIYFDSQTKNASLWEPDNFNAYVKNLSQMEYDSQVKGKSRAATPAAEKAKEVVEI